MRDLILLISISAATIILTVALSLTPLAAVPGLIGLALGTVIVRGSRRHTSVRFAEVASRRVGVAAQLDRSPAA